MRRLLNNLYTDFNRKEREKQIMKENDILKVEEILLDRINLLETELVKYMNQVQYLANALKEKDEALKEKEVKKNGNGKESN